MAVACEELTCITLGMQVCYRVYVDISNIPETSACHVVEQVSRCRGSVLLKWARFSIQRTVSLHVYMLRTFMYTFWRAPVRS